MVEDEALLSRQLAKGLSDGGYAVDCAAEGEQADVLVSTELYDTIVLDLGLPKIDGLSLLRRWRAAGLTTPILILTARGSWHEKVQGIDGGADDYMVKPFRIEELLARVRALIRRTSGFASPELQCAGLALNTATAHVSVEGLPIKLTSHEFRVLSYLMHRQGKIVSRSELIDHIYAQDADRDSNTVEVFIVRLRRKLGMPFIETVRGLGYRLRDPAQPGE